MTLETANRPAAYVPSRKKELAKDKIREALRRNYRHHGEGTSHENTRSKVVLKC